MSLQQTIQIKPGWNWVSFCLKNIQLQKSEITCLNDVVLNSGDFIIKSQTQTAFYYSYNSWLGNSKTLNPSIYVSDQSQLYLFYSNHHITFKVFGESTNSTKIIF